MWWTQVVAKLSAGAIQKAPVEAMLGRRHSQSGIYTAGECYLREEEIGRAHCDQ